MIEIKTNKLEHLEEERRNFEEKKKELEEELKQIDQRLLEIEEEKKKFEESENQEFKTNTELFLESQENEKYEVLNEKDSQDLKEVSVSLDLELNLPSLTNLTTIWSPLLSGELCCIGLTGFELAVHQQQKHGISFEPQEMYSLMKIWGTTFQIIKGAKRKCVYDQCNSTHQNKRRLINHINSIHIKFPAFPCEFCDKEYFSSHKLQEHQKLKHNSKNEAHMIKQGQQAKEITFDEDPMLLFCDANCL